MQPRYSQPTRPLTALFCLLAIATATTPAVAQCNLVWSTLSTGMNAPTHVFAMLPNGDVVAGGAFTMAGGVSANYIASFDGTNWLPLGTGMNGWVEALLALPNGDLVAGGRFTTAGGVSAPYIARWDGTDWSPIGAAIDDKVLALTTLANGDLVAGGTFLFQTGAGVSVSNVARWNGTDWLPLGVGTNAGVYALATLPNGDLVAGGSFATAGGLIAPNIARWDGTNWSSMSTGMNGLVWCLTLLPDGDLVAGGSFSMAGGIAANLVARWDGSDWAPLGTGTNPGTTFGLTTLPNGDLVAAGDFTTQGHLRRWNGASWSTLEMGVNSYSRAAMALSNGELVVGGAFSAAGGSPAAFTARLTTTCPATAVPYGAGCTGSGGPKVLTATTLPWVGSTFRATATGMPALAFAFVVSGFTPISQALSTILPIGVVGCDLLVSPDLIDVVVANAGVAETQVVLPNTPSLAGVVFHHQVVPLAVDASLHFVALTSTNALTLTLGTF